MQDLISQWRQPLLNKLKQAMGTDAAHDLAHIERVTHSAMQLGKTEQANLEVIYPAALLHDCVHVDKKSPLRSKASSMSANQAVQWLQALAYPKAHLEAIHHTIEAHSYSANIQTQTLEAQIVQDADRLDALGAIGLSRCLMLAGQWQSALYHPRDPLAKRRDYDDKNYALDHLFTKLKSLPDTMNTDAGRAEANQRWHWMRQYLAQLAVEIPGFELSSTQPATHSRENFSMSVSLK